MRLNRLLRSTNSSSLSSPVGLPSSSFDKGKPVADRSSGGDNGISPVVHDGGGSHTSSNAARQSSRLIHGIEAAGDEPAHTNCLPGGDTLSFEAQGVSRKLFPPSPEVEDGTFRRNSCLFGGEPSRRSEVVGKRGVAIAGRRADPGREGDDLEDISDGGFHSGCWRRKYVRGEMR